MKLKPQERAIAEIIKEMVFDKDLGLSKEEIEKKTGLAAKAILLIWGRKGG